MKCTGYYDVEASIVIVTRDSHVLLLRSGTQPIEVKTLLTLKSSVVDVVFNGSNVTLATSDRSIKCYTLQVLAFVFAYAYGRNQCGRTHPICSANRDKRCGG